MTDKSTKVSGTLEFLQEAEASVSLNPRFQWARLVVCDDQPNANKQRIPTEEFENIIRTGINSPIKMELGQASDHDSSMGKPIGTITQLRTEGNRVDAIAALWKRERPEDVEFLKEEFKKGNLPQVSWEIAYTDSEVNPDGVESLRGVILDGLCIVPNPAYEGRTPIYAFASKNKENLDVEELDSLKAKIEELEKALAEKDEKISQLEQTQTELAELRSYKQEIEKARAEQERLASIKTKFTEAGLAKDDTFFSEKKDLLIGLDDSALDFMIQEMVSFATKASEAAVKDAGVPNLQVGKESPTDDPKKLSEELRKRLFK